MAAQTLRFQAPVSNIGPRERFFFKGESLANVCFLAKNGRFWKKEFWSAPIYIYLYVDDIYIYDMYMIYF